LGRACQAAQKQVFGLDEVAVDALAGAFQVAVADGEIHLTLLSPLASLLTKRKSSHP